MEKYTVLMNQKTRYCYNGISPQTDLQIRLNSKQNPSKHFCRNWQVDSKIHMDMQRASKSQNNS